MANKFEIASFNLYNFAKKFWEMFGDPTPRDVVIPQKDENGDIIAYTSPNRAKLLMDKTGDKNIRFKVANAVESYEAVNLGQFIAQPNIDGYQKLPSGLIIQWGEIENSTDYDASYYFPVEFPTACFICNVSFAGRGNGGGWRDNYVDNIIKDFSFTKSNFTLARDGSVSGTIKFNYIAIGV